jgi:hypothetical protein
MAGINAVLSDFVGWVKAEPGLALVLFLAIQLVLLALSVAALARGAGLARRQARLLRGTDGVGLQQMLLDYADDAALVREQLTNAHQKSSENKSAIAQSVRRIGLVRYDAFSEMGGQQSFSLALLDESGNGVLLSGLHARQEMRVYAKSVAAGRSAIFLTPEEQQAIREARLPAENSIEMKP